MNDMTDLGVARTAAAHRAGFPTAAPHAHAGWAGARHTGRSWLWCSRLGLLPPAQLSVGGLYFRPVRHLRSAAPACSAASARPTKAV